MMKRTAFFLSAVSVLGLPSIGDGYEEQPLYEVVLYEENLMIPMRDGVELATDIYVPAIKGIPVEDPLPILLHRTPYDKTRQGEAPAVATFVQHGYVVVIQDTRGRYKSEGIFSKYHEFDALDGNDTIEWLAELPYGNGQIGMWGTSYGAHTQADAAKMSPEALKTIVVNQGGTSDSWNHGIRNNGAFELAWQLTWALGQLPGETDSPVVEEMLKTETAEKWFAAQPFRKGLNPLSIAPNFEDYFLTMASNGDAAQWKGLGANWADYYAETSDIPMIHIGGWYDLFAGGTIDNYVGLSAVKKSPVKLLMGPWEHGGNPRSFAGDVEFGPDAAIYDFGTYFHLRWFDHYLKGKPTKVADAAPVKLFVMGTGDGHKDGNGRLYHGGYWREESDWPVSGTEFTKYYFHADGSLSAGMPDSTAPSTTYVFDPENPVPTIGGSYYLRDGGFDQREREDFYGSKPPYLPLKARDDVVVFQSEPLETDVEVVGPIVIHLFASSTAVDTDFTVKLVDVYPPSRSFPTGFDLNLTDGILRARYRNSPSQQELMTPGEVYELVIKPFPTANVFKKGHRIRVDISSSNFPRFDVNPNTGEPLGRHRQMIEASNSVYHSSEYASHIVLPIVPTKRPSVYARSDRGLPP